jgi:5'-nucleotidase
MRRVFSLFTIALLAGCTTLPTPVAGPVGPREVQILAINDFHGNLEPPGLAYDGAKGAVPTGGAA